jgi:hypothetical protein
MKALFVAICGLAMVFFALTAYSDSDPLICTWVNMEYSEEGPPQKVIYNNDGTFATYPAKESAEPVCRGTFTIMRAWQDPEGNFLYEVKRSELRASGFKVMYKLIKISNGGNAMEHVQKSDTCPKNINTDDASYCKYSRE